MAEELSEWQKNMMRFPKKLKCSKCKKLYVPEGLHAFRATCRCKFSEDND